MTALLHLPRPVQVRRRGRATVSDRRIDPIAWFAFRLPFSTDETLFVANSIAALLEATGQILIAGVDYVSRFIRLAEGLPFSPIEIPTSGAPIEFRYFENLAIDAAGCVSVVAKPRERPFASYELFSAKTERAPR